ncbi:hypothetical protein Syun_010655 [Stephania yunnanensis]|uniref:J domain-containing protein n=1 Tax=Stephania yunnanensis TaxID=152371 RepID=A0AAP0KGW7_9MAGN
MIRAPNPAQSLLGTSLAVSGDSRSAPSAAVRWRNPSRRKSVVAVAAATATAAAAANLYEVLRVRRDATAVEIKKAYRHLAKTFHPDVARAAGSDGFDFIEIHNAYVTLSDPTARARYDDSIAVNGRLRFNEAAVGIAIGRWRRWETDQCW